MHYSISTDIKSEIEKIGHQVTNIWNITQHRTKLPLSTFLVDLKPAPNKKDIFQVEHLQQCRITFEPPKPKRAIAQCASGTATPKTIAILNPGAPNALAPTLLISALARLQGRQMRPLWWQPPGQL
jgi:hypothetical protein